MSPDCIAAVSAAAGRALTPAQIKAIDDRMVGTMRRLGRSDPSWRGLAHEERVLAAAKRAQADIAEEAARKLQNAQRQVMKAAETNRRVEKQRTLYRGSTRTAALMRDMDNTADYIDGVKQEAISHLTDLLEAARSGEGLTLGRRALMAIFDADNPAMSRDLALEVFARGDGGTGNRLAQAGAKAWLDVIESLRTRFNAAGGDVRRLEYGYLPKPDDQALVLAAGRDAWANKLLPKVNRDQYLNEDGSRMSDAQVLEILRASWDTISSDGLNKLTPGEFRGTGGRANARGEARVIHFKDGAAYLEYMAEFGRGSMYDAMVSHISGMARDIALVERYGPNPEQQMRVQFQLAAKADGRKPDDLPRSWAVKPESYWSILSGVAGTPQNPRLALIAQTLRNLQTAAKLGAAVISSVTDIGTYFITVGYNKLGYWQALKNIGAQGSKETREFLAMHGAIADSLLSDVNRWSGDHLGHNWAGRLATGTMNLSLMNAWTNALKNAFKMTMMAGMGRLARTDWHALTEFDRIRMERHGITEGDWAVIRQAELTEYNGLEFLTPEAIYASGHPEAQQIVTKVLGLIKDEGDFAVISPDLATRAITTGGGLQAGTVNGEFYRAIWQFKSFPAAMILRHWRRIVDMPQVEGAPFNRLAYVAAMGVSLTVLGAVAFQTKQMLAGKDPVPMDSGRFWLRAGLQGGAMGILGDLLLQDPSDAPGDTVSTTTKNLAGPVLGAGFEAAFKLGVENVWQLAEGKDTHAAAEALRFAKSNTPLINLWYTRAAIDHAFLQQLQENLNPGYLSRMRARARKEWGTDFWWSPGEEMPERAPDMAGAFGR